MAFTFSIFGDDARQQYLKDLLQLDGYNVIHTTEDIRYTNCLLLPVPTLTPARFLRGTDLHFDDVLQSAPPHTIIWGTGFSPFHAHAEEKSIRLMDYNDFEEFASENAIPSAEGAVQLAMEELPVTIHGSHFLVIGYGRIGRCLSAQLSALGGVVTVARRSGIAPQYRTDRTGIYDYPLEEYDAVFNTVPSPVLSADQCLRTRGDCLLVDLASAPGGIDKTSGRRVIHALGLPAKVAPKTAASIMKSIIVSEMEERKWKTKP